MNENYHELRYLETSTPNNNRFSLLDDPEDRLTLLDLVDEYDRIILLGNPGMGKTAELNQTFELLWDKIDETEMLPILINIENFRHTSTIEKMIPGEDWKDMSSVIFILDGLDEIANIQDFIADLQNFMSDNSERKLKFVLSCRTNIYQKYVINISDFKAVYLKSLSHWQIYNIFKNKYEIEISDDNLIQFSTILQTPFNLEMFAEFYKDKQRFPKTLKEALELFIEKEIERSLPSIFKHIGPVTKAEIYYKIKEVAVINELMQQNAISQDDLFKLLKEQGIALFQELPFFEKRAFIDSYVFTHKNYQEYFAALYIAFLPIEKIIEFIKVKDIKKIKPSLFNTITFLLNIITEKDKKKDLEDWLLKNDKEVLFFAEDERLLPKFKNELFEAYFTEVCIDKTFWISNNAKISLDILADFAAFKFLFDEIDNVNRHPRVRASALEVMAYKKLQTSEKELLMNLIIKIIEAEDNIVRMQCLRTFKDQKFYENISFFKSILAILKDSEDADALHQLISIMTKIDDHQRDADQLISIIKKYYSLGDRVIRGTENLIAYLILNTSSRYLNIALLEILFNDHYSLRSNSLFFDNFDEQLIKRSKEFCTDPDYHKELVEMAFADRYRIMSNPVLKNVLLEVGIPPELVIHILQKEKMSTDVLYSLAPFVNNDNIDSIVEGFKNGNIKFNSTNDIDSFRNWIINSDSNLALYFEKKFRDAGHNFLTNIQTDEQILAATTQYDEERDANFELLFKKEKIISDVKTYFQENNVESLTRPEFQKIFWQWYEDHNLHGLQYTVHTIMDTVLRFNRNITPEIIISALEDPNIYLSAIKTGLAHHSFRKLKLDKEQLELIDKLTKAIISEVDYNNIIRINAEDPDLFHATKYLEYINIVLFFDFNYGIKQSPTFYLDVLAFGNITGPNSGQSFIEYVLEKVDDAEVVNEKVIQNITQGELTFIAKRDHYSYAVENNLFETFNKIGEDFKKDGATIDQQNLLEDYVSKIEEPLIFLKECCRDQTSPFYWRVINLIKDKYQDNKFIRDAVFAYLETSDLHFLENAVNILFFLNEDTAILNYYKALKKVILVRPDYSGLFPKDLKHYNRLNEIVLFETLFDLTHEDNSAGSFYLHYSRSFLQSWCSQICEKDEGFGILQRILAGIKQKANTDMKIFYVNDLIDISNNSRLNSKSKEMTFEEARMLINQLS